MRRSASICQETGLRKGAWTEEEDKLLSAYIKKYGHWNWRELPKYAGLSRCGKSCRLRWVNYLQPDIKRGNFTIEEDEIITNHIRKFGNKWSAIVANLPGRTDNDVKNHWHTTLKKRHKPSAGGKEAKRVKPVKSKRASVLGNAFHPFSFSSLILESSTVIPAPQQKVSDSSVSSTYSEAVKNEDQPVRECEIWLDPDVYSREELLTASILEDAQPKSSASSVSTSDPVAVIKEGEKSLVTDKDFEFDEVFSTEPILLEDAHLLENSSPFWIDSWLTHPYSLLEEASYAYDLCNDYSMDFLFSH